MPFVVIDDANDVMKCHLDFEAQKRVEHASLFTTSLRAAASTADSRWPEVAVLWHFLPAARLRKSRRFNCALFHCDSRAPTPKSCRWSPPTSPPTEARSNSEKVQRSNESWPSLIPRKRSGCIVLAIQSRPVWGPASHQRIHWPAAVGPPKAALSHV
jgi:hypothetical protein